MTYVIVSIARYDGQTDWAGSVGFFSSEWTGNFGLGVHSLGFVQI